jgi:spore coat polysaccharide biosynthesis predicted glycosyltransferase SpsG
VREAVVRLVATAGEDEGRGHLSRAIALAGALRDRHLGVQLALLRGNASEREAARLREIAVEISGTAGVPAVPEPAATVVDLPDPNEPGKAASPGLLAGALVVFDDRELFAGAAEVIVQPSLPAWRGPGKARTVLAGYRYAPIAREYRELATGRGGATAAGEPSVLVCFGGADPDLVTERIVRGLPPGQAWRTEVVVGPSYGGPTEDWPVDPARDPADLPRRLASCDLALVGAGTMKFEASCVGRAALLLAVADDQLKIGKPFADTGAARWLGDGRTVDPRAVWLAVAELMADASERGRMGERARAVVDGCGADRVADAIVTAIEG